MAAAAKKQKEPITTEVSELGDSRVRVEVTVPAAEVDRHVEKAAAQLGREIRVPGFRQGKVPPQMVLQRFGRAGVLDEALRTALPEWYERGLLASGVSSVGDPELDVSELPEQGEPLVFSFEIASRPEARLGEYKRLEVGREEAEVPEEIVEREIDRLRESMARLEPVERAAASGDFVLVDYRGEVDGEPFDGGEGSDQLIELGSESLVEGFEAGIEGASAGEERDVEVRFPDDYRAEQLAGKQASFHITVKEVREKILPELDDDLAGDVSEFDTVAELRADIEARVREVVERRVDEQFREAVVDAVAANAAVTIPEALATARATEMWTEVERRLQAQGIGPEVYLQMQGKSREEIIAEGAEDAAKALRREAALAAVADAEGIEISEEEMLAALDPHHGHDHDHDHHDHDHDHPKPEKALKQLRESGRDVLLAEDLRLRKAADLVVESAQPISVGAAEAREKLWTPGDD